MQAITPVMEIISADEQIITSDVLTENISALHLGQSIEVIQKTYQGDISYRGRIVHIDDYARKKISSLGLEEQRVQVKSELLDIPKMGLGNGFRVTVVFDIFNKENILVIGKLSYFEEEGKNYVWLVKEGKLIKMPIEIGYIGQYEVEIKSGLSEGDIIVKDPNDSRLKTGTRIAVLE